MRYKVPRLQRVPSIPVHSTAKEAVARQPMVACMEKTALCPCKVPCLLLLTDKLNDAFKIVHPLCELVIKECPLLLVKLPLESAFDQDFSVQLVDAAIDDAIRESTDHPRFNIVLLFLDHLR